MTNIEYRNSLLYVPQLPAMTITIKLGATASRRLDTAHAYSMGVGDVILEGAPDTGGGFARLPFIRRGIQLGGEASR